jgi:hypothetical protein
MLPLEQIVYHMLKDKREYFDSGAAAYEDKYKEQMLKNLRRKAKLGMKLIPTTV